MDKLLTILRDHRHTDGRTTSWATEAELYAASSLYSININVDTDEYLNWHTHAFRIDENGRKPNFVLYSSSVYVRLQHNNFNLLVKRDTEEVETTTATDFDWFDMTSSNMNEINTQVNHENTRASGPDEIECSNVFNINSKRERRVKSIKGKSKVKKDRCE